MLINAKARYSGVEDLHCHETASHRIYWKGLIHKVGFPAGLACVTSLAKDLQNRGLEHLSSDLRGCFFLLVQDKASGTCSVLVDNSGLYQVFYSDQGVSSSFLELASFHRLNPVDLDPESVVEFLHFGNVSFNRTLFQSIRKLPGEQIAVIAPGQGISFVEKSLPALDVPTRYSLEDFFRDFAASVSTEQVSVDLTGGMDTRIIAILLQYFGLPFEVAIRGNEENLDVLIAREVASALGKELQVCRPRIENMEDDLDDVLSVCDGLMDVVTSYGSLQLQYERVQRGVTLMVSGAGGELFRDHLWLQDFPFYARSKPNLRRFCDLRLLPTDPEHSYLTGKYRDVSLGYRQRLLRNLAPYAVAGNTQTYDQIAYRVLYRESIGRFLTNHTHVLPCSALFMEREAIRYGYQLPRWSRFFDYYFRKTATRCLPEAARNRTTKNYTLSTEFSSLVKDIYKYSDDKLTRVSRRVGQRYFHRNYRSCGKMDEPLGHTQLIPSLRRSQRVKSAIQQLKDASILHPTVSSDDMKEQYLGTVLTLGLVMDRLGVCAVSH